MTALLYQQTTANTTNEIPSYLRPFVLDNNYISFNKIPTERFVVPERNPTNNKAITNVVFGPLCFLKSEGSAYSLNNIVWNNNITTITFTNRDALKEKILTWPENLTSITFNTNEQLNSQINIDKAFAQKQAVWDDTLSSWVHTHTVYNLAKKTLNGVNERLFVNVSVF
jgi:hypothetical protein